MRLTSTRRPYVAERVFVWTPCGEVIASAKTALYTSTSLHEVSLHIVLRSRLRLGRLESLVSRMLIITILWSYFVSCSELQGDRLAYSRRCAIGSRLLSFLLAKLHPVFMLCNGMLNQCSLHCPLYPFSDLKDYH